MLAAIRIRHDEFATREHVARIEDVFA